MKETDNVCEGEDTSECVRENKQSELRDRTSERGNEWERETNE